MQAGAGGAAFALQLLESVLGVLPFSVYASEIRAGNAGRGAEGPRRSQLSFCFHSECFEPRLLCFCNRSFLSLARMVLAGPH